MELLKPDQAGIARAGAALAQGLLVAIPTETVYGLGASAFDAKAVARVFEAKARPSFDPLIVHLSDLEMISSVAELAEGLPRRLAEALWPGPLTLILPKKEAVPGIVTSGLETVAVRIPAHPLAREVIRAAGIPVAAPSANPFGYLSPTRAEHVARMLGSKVDFILDGGACEIGVESTVLDLTSPRPQILRPGGMPRSRIEAIAGPVDCIDRTSSAPTSPGQLPSHYAPRVPLILVEAGALREARPSGRAAAILFSAKGREALDEAAGSFASLHLLSPSGDLSEAAQNLFTLLHDLDRGAYDEIWAERVPPEGLGAAVNDRLYKASKKD